MGKRKIDKSEPREEIDEPVLTDCSGSKLTKVTTGDLILPEKAEEKKPNKKLLTLEHAVVAKSTEIEKFLLAQGLGQNARLRVFNLFNELNIARNVVETERSG